MVFVLSELILKACSESLTQRDTLFPFEAAMFAITVPKLPPPRTAMLTLLVSIMKDIYLAALGT